ncbi:MAG: OsmC family protein [Anaerolineaceae bacterium]|nr:OsmC family protein [Anaerolineaceae bacterium]
MAAVTFKAVTHKGSGGLVAESEARGFKIVMDEPENLGGTDKGMNPVEGLLVSLGSCLVIVGSAFAKGHGIDLQDLWVETEGDLDPDGFLLGKEGVRPGFQAVRFTIHIKSSSPEDKLREFKKFIESRCPVSDTLGNGTRVTASELVIEK